MKKNLFLLVIIAFLFSCNDNTQIQPVQNDKTAVSNRNAKTLGSYNLFKVSFNGVDTNLNPPKEVFIFENGGGAFGAGTGGGAQSNPVYKFSRTVNGRTVEKGNAQFVTTPDGNNYFKFFSSDPAFPNGSYTQWFVVNSPTTTIILMTKRIAFTTPISITDRLAGLAPVSDLTRYHYLYQ